MDYRQQQADLNRAKLIAAGGLWPQLINNPGAIYYEDEALLVINKPAGMLVHPTVKEDGYTLYNYVQRYYEATGSTATLHPVSRLDRNTSGLVIFAKEPRVQALLAKQEIAKEYLALVTGTLPCSHGFIEEPIARKEGSIIERCVSPQGKPCKTEYKILEKVSDITLVQIRLYTGRTHQIRVHFAYIGCPLYQDNLYGTPGPQSRHGLHAYKLAFSHPYTGVPLEISCGLPRDLQQQLYRGC